MPLLETSISSLSATAGKPKLIPTTFEDKSALPALHDWPNDAGFHSSIEEQPRRKLKVTGNFPSFTAGRLFRTGPQARKVDGFELSHWFDGFTSIHRFDLTPNESTGSIDIDYASRGQVDALIEIARKDAALPGFTFGQKRDPCDSYFQKVKSVFQSVAGPTTMDADVMNIGIALRKKPNVSSAESLTATTDQQFTKDFDSVTLEPLGVTELKHFHPDLIGPLSAAHPAFDPENGDMYNYNLTFGPKPTYRIFKTDASSGATEILATISDKKVPASYIHSLFITENFVILCVWPAYFAGGGVNVLWTKNLLEAMRFKDSAPCHWFVVDRRHGRGIVKRFTSPAMFAFHSTNSFEEVADNDTIDITCELVEFPNMDILSRLYYENLISTGKGAAKSYSKANPSIIPRLVRYKLAGIPIASSESKTKMAPQPAQILSGTTACGELPTINPNFATKPHRYVYGIADRGLSSFVDGISKTDATTGTAIYWSTPKHSPGEPIFIPRPDGTAEDEGVLLTVVLDGACEKSYLLCLDAMDLSELARAEVESAVGIGFHGLFLKDS